MKRHAPLLLLVAAWGCSGPDTVVVYSPHGKDILDDYEKMFEAANPGVDVQCLDLPSQEVYLRVSAERQRPACDIWWGAPSTMFIKAAQEGLLEPYRPSWDAAIGQADKDPDGCWYGTHLTPLSIMFDNRTYTRKDVPQTWDELLDPKWAGKITIRRPPQSGTMRSFLGAMILRAGSEEKGIEWLKKLDASTESYLQSPQYLFDHIKRVPGLITVWIMPDAVLQRERNGYPFDFFIPPSTPVLTEGIAIVKGAPHREWAEKFYEFVSTREAFVHQAETYGKIPSRSDIDRASLPAWMFEQPIDPMPIDWKTFAARELEWCERWEREVFDAR